MNRAQQLKIFRAQVENIKELEVAWRHIKRSINSDLLTDRLDSARVQTKTLTLVYCAWSEAVLSKLVHTPHGFELDEIMQIKAAQDSSIVAAWEKTIELASRKVGSRRGSYMPNIRQRLKGLLSTYIRKPSLVRNKVAHGQWKWALNRDNTNVNPEISEHINSLSVVQLDAWRDVFLGMSAVVEAMIESPDRAFHRDYWPIIAKIERNLAETAGYSLDSKVALLKAKALRSAPKRSLRTPPR